MNHSWQGYYKQFNNKYPMHFNQFRINPDNTIYGKGLDTVGVFQINGNIQENNKATFVKQYIQMHKVQYFGTYNGYSISGHWGWEQGAPQEEFQIKPKATAG